LFAVEARAAQQFDHADHAIERRTDLMADDREELALRRRGSLRSLHRCAQFVGARRDARFELAVAARNRVEHRVDALGHHRQLIASADAASMRVIAATYVLAHLHEVAEAIEQDATMREANRSNDKQRHAEQRQSGADLDLARRLLRLHFGVDANRIQVTVVDQLGASQRSGALWLRQSRHRVALLSIVAVDPRRALVLVVFDATLLGANQQHNAEQERQHQREQRHAQEAHGNAPQEARPKHRRELEHQIRNALRATAR
jgi:hypothetical protein